MIATGKVPEHLLVKFTLSQGNATAMLINIFRHGSWSHLLFNMLYLWLFGNALCEKVGNLYYVFFFLFFAICGNLLHLSMDSRTAIGASGAIYGVLGCYLALHPRNNVNFFWYALYRTGTFGIASIWVITFWFLQDLFAVLVGIESGVAYWAHIGGFASGLAVGLIFPLAGWIHMAPNDNPTITDYFRRWTAPPVTLMDFDGDEDINTLYFPCKSCGRPVPQPDSAQMNRVQCPHCNVPLPVPGKTNYTEETSHLISDSPGHKAIFLAVMVFIGWTHFHERQRWESYASNRTDIAITGDWRDSVSAIRFEPDGRYEFIHPGLGTSTIPKWFASDKPVQILLIPSNGTWELDNNTVTTRNGDRAIRFRIVEQDTNTLVAAFRDGKRWRLERMP